ncbi:MAG: tetratricopeptide repeat protein [Bacteroidia bacterium]
MENHSHNHHPHKHFSPVSFVAGLIIALIVFFVLYKTYGPRAAAQKNSVTTDSAKIQKAVEVVPKKDSLDFSEEHFHRHHHHRHIDADVEDIVVAPNEMAALEKGNLSAQQKKLLELLPNAPSIYIFDLKVSDYKNLYFTTDGPLMLNGKIPAGQLLHDGLKDFSEKKFTAAFNKMTELSMANPNDVNALFYGGMAAYYSKDYDEAILRFEKVSASANNCFKQEATWFKAMALFTNGKREEARNLLKEIADTQGFYARKASGLLEQL